MRLNPFVYISETDIRFYLLVIIGIIMPSIYVSRWGIDIVSAIGGLLLLIGSILLSFEALSVGIAITEAGIRVAEAIDVLENSFFPRLLIMGVSISFIPLLIYWNYKRFPKKIIKKSKLKEFSKKKFPDHCKYIENLYGKYQSTVKQPTLMYHRPREPLESAFTFGTKNHMYIGINGGLIRKFRKNIAGFKSIFLHEMGHIVNRDVEKVYLAASTWRSLFLIMPIWLGTYLLGALMYASVTERPLANFIEILIEYSGHLIIGGTFLYFLLFLVIVYVLRKQIIRVREFYADAKVLEWEESPKDMVKTLEEFSGEQHSRFEILTKFHPNINERIQMLKNNSGLFTTSLWIAYATGFSYSLIEYSILPIAMIIFRVPPTVTALQDTVTRALISLFFFPVIMLAVSSCFHKSVLKDVFIDNKAYFSTATILKSVKFSMAFSLGWITYSAISFIPNMYRYAPAEIMTSYLQVPIAWIFHAVYFSVILIFLLIFASLLIRRSFSKKDAKRNFLTVTVFSSVLYTINRYAAIEILYDVLLMIAFSLIFLVVTYTFIRIKDRKLRCPNCNSKISNLSQLKLSCSKCHRNLYSWAIYPFSKGIKKLRLLSEISPETAKDVPTKEKRKPMRKTIIAISLIVVAVGAIGFWSYTQRVPPAPLARYETYSKYGFSFEYPEDMTISEQGLLEDRATDSSGMVLGTLENDKYELVFVGWMESAIAPSLEASLEVFLDVIAEGKANFEIGELVETTKAGRRLIYQYYTFTIEGEASYGIHGVWYCDTNQRLYQLHLVYSEEDNLPIYQRYLDSFVCHG